MESSKKQPPALPFITSCILCSFVAVMFMISGETVLHERRQLRKNASRRKTILNGWTVNEKQRKRFEYTSSVQYGSSHICGASLIAPDIVLSAAHCFDPLHRYDLSFLKVVVGEFHLLGDNDGGEDFGVDVLETHPQYVRADAHLENDVVVMKIKGRSQKKFVHLNGDNNVPTSQRGAPVADPSPGSSHRELNPMLLVLGWGSLDAHGNVMANELQRLQLHYMSNQYCVNNSRIPHIADSMMCAMDLDGDNLTEDSCYGDSGGPLLLPRTHSTHGIDMQVGIISYGSEVCGEDPGIYTRISSVYEWVRERVCDLSSDAPEYLQC